jgi:hypothetical protein
VDGGDSDRGSLSPERSGSTVSLACVRVAKSVEPVPRTRLRAGVDSFCLRFPCTACVRGLDSIERSGSSTSLTCVGSRAVLREGVDLSRLRFPVTVESNFGSSWILRS